MDSNSGTQSNGSHKDHQGVHELPASNNNPPFTACTWLERRGEQRQNAATIRTNELNPSVNALWDLIDNNAEVRSLFTQMLQQVPDRPPYEKSPTGGPRLNNWQELLRAFSNQLTRGPAWLYNTPGQQGLIGFPFNAVLVRYRNVTAPLLLRPSGSRTKPGTFCRRKLTLSQTKELVHVHTSRSPRLPPPRRQRPPARHPHRLWHIPLLPSFRCRSQFLSSRLARQDRAQHHRFHCFPAAQHHQHPVRVRVNTRHVRPSSPNPSPIPWHLHLRPEPPHPRLRLLGRLLHAPLPIRYPTHRFSFRRQRHSQRLRIHPRSAPAWSQVTRWVLG